MLGSPIGDYYISPIDPGLNQFPGADGNKPAASGHFYGVDGMIPTARVFPIHRFFFKGSLVDRRVRASIPILFYMSMPSPARA